MCLGSTYFECCLTPLSLFPNIPPGPLKWELSAYIAKLRRATDEIYFIDDGFTQRVNPTNSTDLSLTVFCKTVLNLARLLPTI